MIYFPKLFGTKWDYRLCLSSLHADPSHSKVANLSFWSQKMHNVLKCVQSNFSIFFSFNKIFILSFWNLEISGTPSLPAHCLFPLFQHLFWDQKHNLANFEGGGSACHSLRKTQILFFRYPNLMPA